MHFLFFQMNNLNQIAAAGNSTGRLSDLQSDHLYLIVSTRRVNTQYGPRSIVNMEGVDYFLPKRISIFLHENADEYANLQHQISERKAYLKYKGGQWNDMEFVFL